MASLWELATATKLHEITLQSSLQRCCAGIASKSNFVKKKKHRQS